MHAGYIMLVVETQESVRTEKQALSRLLSAVDGVILSSSRMPDASIRDAAKHRPLVLLNRIVGQIPSVATDNLNAMMRASEHLAGAGVREITYLAGPEASWSDGTRWQGLRAAGLELILKVRRIGPNMPTMAGGGLAATKWLGNETRGVIAYNDLLAIGLNSRGHACWLSGTRGRLRDWLRQHSRLIPGGASLDYHRGASGQSRLRCGEPSVETQLA